MSNGESVEVESWRWDQIIALLIFGIWMVVEVARSTAQECSRQIYFKGVMLAMSQIVIVFAISGSLLLVLVIDILYVQACPSVFAVVTGMVLAQLLDRRTPLRLLPQRLILQEIFKADKMRFGQPDKIDGTPGQFIVRYDPKLKRGPNGRSTWKYHSQDGKKKLTKDEWFDKRADPVTQNLVRQVLRGEDNASAEAACGYALFNWLPTGAHDIQFECKGDWKSESSLVGRRKGMVGIIQQVDQSMVLEEWCIEKKREFYGIWFSAYWSKAHVLVRRLNVIAEQAIDEKEAVQMLEASMWEIVVGSLPDMYGVTVIQRERSAEQRRLAQQVGAYITGTSVATEL